MNKLMNYLKESYYGFREHVAFLEIGNLERLSLKKNIPSSLRNQFIDKLSSLYEEKFYWIRKKLEVQNAN